MLCNSWIITRLDTGAAVMETWNAELITRVNLKKYRVQTAYEYLTGLNTRRTSGKQGG